jgi:hypothetical protein
MKSNCYASIDAHIIRCKLHHHNNLSYSVALKLGTTSCTQAKINKSPLPSRSPKNSSSIWTPTSRCKPINIHMNSFRK